MVLCLEPETVALAPGDATDTGAEAAERSWYGDPAAGFGAVWLSPRPMAEVLRICAVMAALSAATLAAMALASLPPPQQLRSRERKPILMMGGCPLTSVEDESRWCKLLTSVEDESRRCKAVMDVGMFCIVVDESLIDDGYGPGGRNGCVIRKTESVEIAMTVGK